MVRSLDNGSRKVYSRYIRALSPFRGITETLEGTYRVHIGSCPHPITAHNRVNLQAIYI